MRIYSSHFIDVIDSDCIPGGIEMTVFDITDFPPVRDIMAIPK